LQQRQRQPRIDGRAAAEGPDVHHEAEEEQRGGKTVVGCQAAKVLREPGQGHVPEQESERDERYQETASKGQR